MERFLVLVLLGFVCLVFFYFTRLRAGGPVLGFQWKGPSDVGGCHGKRWPSSAAPVCIQVSPVLALLPAPAVHTFVTPVSF